MRGIIYFAVTCCLLVWNCTNERPRRAEVLFLSGGALEAGQTGKYATWLAVELFKAGINLTYTEDVNDLHEDKLNRYDGLIIYGSHDSLSSSQESAMKAFLEKGKGIIPISLGSIAFGSSQWYSDIVGGKLTTQQQGALTIEVMDTSYQVTEGVAAFDVDERYTFEWVNPENTVLLEAVENETREPYAWVRTAGRGRVFFTPLGNSEATWKNRSFLRLLRNGTLWAVGDKVRELIKQLDIPDVSIYPDSIADFTARHDVPKMQDPLSPEESMKLMQVPVDFEIKLFAAEPDIVNPMAMSWDERGRLWIIEAVDYPNNFVEIKGENNDRIKICEDTNGDGVADKFTVFAEGLNIASSLTFINDGVLVAMAPHFIFLKDTDGDDVADVKETVMTGWNKNDTHAGPSNLQYGFDNKIWGVTGYAGFNGDINGKRHTFGQGLYHFNPDGTDFEFLATTSNNTWGLGMTEDNNVFISTANNTHSAFYSMPEKLFQRKVKEGHRRQQVNAIQKIDGHYDVHALTPNLRQVDVVGGFTSAAGHQLYTARDYPESYWNKVAFVTEPTVRLVHNALIKPDGAGFKEEDGWNLVTSSDEWYGPIHAEVGPDGAVWVLDWYNFIIQHNVFVPAQAPSEKVLPFTDQPHGPGNAFESDLRDKKHGRVYRIVHKKGKHKEQHQLSKDNSAGLLKALKSDNKFWRMHAQRLLVERQKEDVVNDLVNIALDKKVDKIGLNAPAIHALWTLQGLHVIETNKKVFDAAVTCLKHPSAGVRKAAIQVLPINSQSLEAILASEVLKDDQLNTRLAAFVRMAEYPASGTLAGALLAATNDAVNESDRWLSQALFGAITQHEGAFHQVTAQGSRNAFADRILEALADERYVLGRRTRLQFSPDVSNKEIHIETEVSRRDNQRYNGLIVGQGDQNDGYALYLKDDRLFFEVYQHGQGTTVSSKGRVPNSFTVKAQITADATAKLLVNNVSQGEAKIMHLFTAPLKLYLRSGQDFDDKYAFTDYGGSSEFTGNVNNITVRLSKAHGGHQQRVTSEADETESTTPSERIELKAVKDIMQYDKKLITVQAGKRITLIFENPDGMQHNLLIIQPGTLEIVGKAADDMLRSSEAFDKQYIPDIPEVLHHTPLVDPGESFTLEFTAPKEAGDYPYVCTFPGHWRGMNGIMSVVK
ncbi:PVC-type heme-binding CxxCH protein [Parapedobacter tibetensis]|uniref:PVC-type heme-binding CxxCH protein n=1 Tax=Parapedobacter tibetensis TaxID=2972951 RepID=UPI00214DBBB3|nr:PVC-type heme-binding CxxCH protein [Parapedobacter tibetensis]